MQLKKVFSTHKDYDAHKKTISFWIEVLLIKISDLIRFLITFLSVGKDLRR